MLLLAAFLGFAAANPGSLRFELPTSPCLIRGYGAGKLGEEEVGHIWERDLQMSVRVVLTPVSSQHNISLVPHYASPALSA